MAIDVSGNIYITGSIYTEIDTADYYTFKYDEDGNELWSIHTDGAAHLNDKATNIALDDNGDIIVTGQSETEPGKYEYFTVKYIEREVITPTDYYDEEPNNIFLYYENRGQLINTSGDPVPEIRYYTNNTNPEFYIKDDSLSFVFAHVDTMASTEDTLHRIDVTFDRVSEDARTYPLEEKEEYLNYYLGHCPGGITEVHANQRLITINLYDKIDMMYSSNHDGIKIYYIIKPGGQPNDIQMTFDGAESCELDGGTNALTINSSIGSITFDQPTVYQLNSNNEIVTITGWTADWTENGASNKFKFYTGSYNTSLPLIILVDLGNSMFSPLTNANLEWCTFYGGESADYFLNVESNSSNNIWVTGTTVSDSFPTYYGAYMDAMGGFDIVLLRFDDEDALKWATYYGGSGDEGIPETNYGKAGIAVDYSGNCYISSSTDSSGLPLKKPNNLAFIDSMCDCEDVIIAMFDSIGTLVWSTYFGEGPCINAIVSSHAIKLDRYGNLYVTGIDKINEVNPLPFYNSLYTFIAKFDSDHQLIWSTYFGGTDEDRITDMSFDNNNSLFITGYTKSHDYPFIAPGTGMYLQNTLGGGICDGFITKFINDWPNWSTYFGGSGDDYVNGICSDQNGNIYLTGKTNSENFPVDSGMGYFEDTLQDASYTYYGDAFFAMFSPTGATQHITYYGGLGSDEGTDIIVDEQNNIYSTLKTTSNGLDFANPNLPNSYIEGSKTGWQDAFVVVFDNSFNLEWTTYFGGFESGIYDCPTALTLTENNKLYVVGITGAIDSFPCEPSDNPLAPFYDTIASVPDGYIAKFSVNEVLGYDYANTKYNSLLIYPNPAYDKLNVLLSGEINSYEIINITGQLVKSGKFHNQINITDLLPGMYLIRVITRNDVMTAKFIKTNYVIITPF
jgi:hypothetical protein